MRWEAKTDGLANLPLGSRFYMIPIPHAAVMLPALNVGASVEIRCGSGVSIIATIPKSELDEIGVAVQEEDRITMKRTPPSLGAPPFDWPLPFYDSVSIT